MIPFLNSKDDFKKENHTNMLEKTKGTKFKFLKINEAEKIKNYSLLSTNKQIKDIQLEKNIGYMFVKNNQNVSKNTLASNYNSTKEKKNFTENNIEKSLNYALNVK